MNKILYILFLAILAWACQSPLDVDTPRSKDSKVTIKAKCLASEYSIEQNGLIQNYEMSTAYVGIDTNKSPNVIWLEMALDNKVAPSEYSGLFVKKMEFALDSLRISPEAFTITNGYSLGLRGRGGARYQIWRGGGKDTIIESGWDRNHTEIYFSREQNSKELWAFVNSKIYENKITVVLKDTTVKNPYTGLDSTYWFNKQIEVKDSIFINAKFKIKIL